MPLTEQQEKILERTRNLTERLREFRETCQRYKMFQLASVLKYHTEELERCMVSQKLELEFLPLNWSQDEKDLILW